MNKTAVNPVNGILCISLNDDGMSDSGGGGSTDDMDSKFVEDLLSDTDLTVSTMEKKNVPPTEDVAPVFILQPKEIIKNIDLMKTVAILMENKLQTCANIKRLDREKMNDICDDVQRFPEAFLRCFGIIHQIQYLNVTSDWNCTNLGENIPVSSSTSRSIAISRLFGLSNHQSDPSLAEYDARKQVMLHLHDTLQQVVLRYLKIQNALEDKLKKFTELLQNKCSNSTTESEDDDPNLPLLVTSQRRSQSNRTSRIWMERLGVLHGILRKTKKSGVEVQDSLEVLHDLILWDYKQNVSAVSPRNSSSEGNSGGLFSVRVDGNSYIGYEPHASSEQMSPNFLTPSNRQRSRKICTVTAILAGIVVVLLVVAGLSFIRFHY